MLNWNSLNGLWIRNTVLTNQRPGSDRSVFMICVCSSCTVCDAAQLLDVVCCVQQGSLRSRCRCRRSRPPWRRETWSNGWRRKVGHSSAQHRLHHVHRWEASQMKMNTVCPYRTNAYQFILIYNQAWNTQYWTVSAVPPLYFHFQYFAFKINFCSEVSITYDEM